jgi:quercetin dioxygenase-like cupin family protein
MDLMTAETITTHKAPASYFTGTVWQERLNEAPDPARLRAVRVTFEPGARTAWHTHPLGQTLYVLSGLGLVQKRGESARIIRPGDVVWIPPGEIHWHGAASGHAMCHLALQEALNGSPVDWMEHVTDADYGDAARGAV